MFLDTTKRTTANDQKQQNTCVASDHSNIGDGEGGEASERKEPLSEKKSNELGQIKEFEKIRYLSLIIRKFASIKKKKFMRLMMIIIEQTNNNNNKTTTIKMVAIAAKTTTNTAMMMSLLE